jgi:hypothetical protein
MKAAKRFGPVPSQCHGLVDEASAATQEKRGRKGRRTHDWGRRPFGCHSRSSSSSDMMNEVLMIFRMSRTENRCIDRKAEFCFPGTDDAVGVDVLFVVNRREESKLEE